MKVAIYSTTRGGSNRFNAYANEYNDVELVDFNCPPTLKTIPLIKEHGCEGILYYADAREDDDFYRALAQNGIKYMCCCSTGYDFFNLEAMKKYGIKGANVPGYSPNAISEHAVLLLLGVLRKFRSQLLHVEKNDYNINSFMGREIRNMSIGIVGAGRIGLTTMKCLSGFQPKHIYAFDLYPRDAVREYAQYLPLDELYRTCDVIIFHCTYNETNHHMINRESISRMKDGVVLINVARGGLFELTAVLEGVRSGKIGGLGLDVVENEGALEKAVPGGECPLPELRELLKYENVIFTNHTAFFSDQAEHDLAHTTIDNLHSYAVSGSCKNELVR